MEETGRRNEIEVTPQMLSAGVEAACLFDPSGDEFEVMLPTIFQAMFQASHLSVPNIGPKDCASETSNPDA